MTTVQDHDQQTQERALAARGRFVSLVIAGTMLAWLGIQFVIGPALGLTARYVILIDLIAMAALAWSFIVAFQIRRARQTARGNE